MAEGKKYNWAKWDIKEQPKIELEDIPEEPKKERTAAERDRCRCLPPYHEGKLR